MRRSIILSTVLAVSAAIVGACSGTPANNAPVKPAPPAATASPTPAATASPTPAVSPTKPGTTPEVKKDDKPVNKDVKDKKPVTTETPKAK